MEAERKDNINDGVQMRCKGVAAGIKDKDIERYRTAIMMCATMSEVVGLNGSDYNHMAPIL